MCGSQHGMADIRTKQATMRRILCLLLLWFGVCHGFAPSNMRIRPSSALRETPSDEEWQLPTVDLLALWVAAPVYQLVETINQDDFVRKGGWLQPVTSDSMGAIGTVVQLWCEWSLLWLLTSLVFQRVSTPNAWTSALPTAAGFGVLRILVALLTHGTDVWHAAQEVYVVTLLVSVTRYLQSQLFA